MASPPPDHSKVYDSFMVHVSSNQNNIDQLKVTDFWLEKVGGMKYLVGGATDYIDSIYPLDNKELERIRRFINVNVNKEFMNYEDITINFPDNQKEFDLMDNLVSGLYIFSYLAEDVDDEVLQEKKDNELKVSVNRYNESLAYFNSKYDTSIDKMYNIKIYRTLLSAKGKMLRYIAELEKPKGEPDVYYYTLTSPVIYDSKLIGTGFVYGYFDQNGDDTPIEQVIYEDILESIEDASFGTNIGEVANIIDSNLVTIKLNKLDLIKGTDLISLGRGYPPGKSDESLKRYIEDQNIIYNYFHEHPDQIENLEYVSDHASNDDWLIREREKIDSLKTNFHTIINNDEYGLSWGFTSNEFRYYLRILNIQDSIATAKITGSIFPFAKPMIGDKINIK